jgi:hypothetical protein
MPSARDLDLADAVMRHGGDKSGIPVIEAQSAAGHARELFPDLPNFQPRKKYLSMRPRAVSAPPADSENAP